MHSSLDGLHGDHGGFIDHDGLTDIQPAHFFRQSPAEPNVLPLGRGRLAMCEKTVIHEKLRTEVKGRLDLNVVAGELPDDRQQQRIIRFIVGRVLEQHVERAPIRQVTQPAERVEQGPLLDLSRHDHAVDLLAAIVADGAAQTAEMSRLKVIAQIAKLFGSESMNPHAADGDSELARRFCKDNGEPPRARQQADAVGPMLILR